jgi:hypothetical protein
MSIKLPRNGDTTEIEKREWRGLNKREERERDREK